MRKANGSLAPEEDGEWFTLADHESSRSVVDLARTFVQRSDLCPNCDTFCVTEVPPQDGPTDV